MKYKKTIDEILDSWGNKKREIPINNEALKNQILSKVPALSSVSKIYPQKSPYVKWLSFSLTAAAVAVLLVNVSGYPVNVYKNSGVPGISGSTDVSIQSSVEYDGSAAFQESNSKLSAPTNGVSLSAPDSYRSIAPMPPYYQEESPISDSREFLKQSYYATLRARKISETQARAEVIVRGMGGRIDSSSSGEKYGYVSFAVPKDRLEAFRLTIKDLVGERFYEEQTGSENLLSQKQNIEERAEETEKSISNLKSERAGIVKNHSQIISAYQNNINIMQAEMAALNYEYQTATYARKIEIENKLRELQGKINAIQSEITRENKNYSGKLSNIDSQIKYYEADKKMIQKQDKNLLESVATVNGSISLTEINLWEFWDEYTPGPLLAWILLLAAAVSYFWYRRTSRISYDY